MDDKSRIRLDIPDPEDFEVGSWPAYIPVPSSVVTVGIELLQCILAQWKQEEGLMPDERVWDAMVVSTAQMLSGLMGAYAAYFHESGARELVEQIDRFCNWSDSPPNLYDSSRDKRLHDFAALRTDARTADIVDALEALHDERQRRAKERQQLRAASEQGPVAERDSDAGWNF